MNQGRIKIQINVMQESECIQNLNFHLAFYDLSYISLKQLIKVTIGLIFE